MKKQVTIYLWTYPCLEHGEHVALFGGDGETIDLIARALMASCNRSTGPISAPRKGQFLLDMDTGDVDEVPY